MKGDGAARDLCGFSCQRALILTGGILEEERRLTAAVNLYKTEELQHVTPF